MTMEYIILEYRLSSEIDFSSLTYFSCLVKKKLPAACRGRAGQRGRPCITIAPAAGRPPNLFGERDHIQEEMHYITEEMAAESAGIRAKKARRAGRLSLFRKACLFFAGKKPGSPCFLRRSQVKFRCQHEISSRFRRKLLTKSLFCCQSPGGGSARSRRAGEV